MVRTNSINIFLSEHESAFISLIRNGRCDVRARGAHIVARPKAGRDGRGGGGGGGGESREWSVAGTACIHCQDNGFQEVYGGCARALPRTRPTGRSPSISHSIHQARLPHPRIYLTNPSTYSSCSSHSDPRGSLSRKVGIPLAESSGLRRFTFSRSALDGCAAWILASRCVACERELRIFNGYNVALNGHVSD